MISLSGTLKHYTVYCRVRAYRRLLTQDDIGFRMGQHRDDEARLAIANFIAMSTVTQDDGKGNQLANPEVSVSKM